MKNKTHIKKELFIDQGEYIQFVKNFREALKHKDGMLFIRSCITPLEGAFCFNDTVKEALIGDLSTPLSWDDYHAAYYQVMQ